MTNNEKIEKKFLFDLEMGIFKVDKQSDVIVFHKEKTKYLQLEAILNKFGFTRLTFSNSYSTVIGIDLNEKIYFINIREIPDFSYDIKCFNKIPEYIMEYKLWLIMK